MEDKKLSEDEVVKESVYVPTGDELKTLENNFTYHRPTDDQTTRYQEIRSSAKLLYALLLHSCPASRERSIAITCIEDAVMWANASIARNEADADQEAEKLLNSSLRLRHG